MRSGSVEKMVHAKRNYMAMGFSALNWIVILMFVLWILKIIADVQSE